ncbi:hypothetical protein BD777DRAFT_34173 [Yarrowia lipolytica]|uniref:Uncharacterized protein n=1 Tax=Yarrowia lipolytica TaxID=4952 RepID=A0A1D8NJY0_YARLL|nr:hypothetical protein YALI1_E29792g [Yarrowia lipolytica]RMI98587.1 hypothetical protein BD777DRAFT_34173 [Yarrowia lipolytica]
MSFLYGCKHHQHLSHVYRCHITHTRCRMRRLRLGTWRQYRRHTTLIFIAPSAKVIWVDRDGGGGRCANLWLILVWETARIRAGLLTPFVTPKNSFPARHTYVSGLWRELPRHRYLVQKTSSDDSALQETALPKISKQPPRPREGGGDKKVVCRSLADKRCTKKQKKK